MNTIRSRQHKGTSLQHRLTFFFMFIAVFIVLSFTVLLTIFNITDGERNALSCYMNNELSHISNKINDDFGKLSVTGVMYADNTAQAADVFFKDNNITANELSNHPELIEPFISHITPYAISVIENNSCGGVFCILDSTIRINKPVSVNSKSGFFIRKTQPVSTLAKGGKKHCLRGPASVARENNIELMGQWKMDYDISNEDFYYDVINTAKKNPDKSLSRLYYWTDQITLKNDSEANLLLCLPLRSRDGCVYGICGISVSELMFKQLYSPDNSTYENICFLASPSDETNIYSSKGLLAGNSYLSGTHPEYNLQYSHKYKGFKTYSISSSEKIFGGFDSKIKLYPSGSPYEHELWSASIIMPYDILNKEITGFIPYLYAIIVILFMISISLSLFISRHYLKPVNTALDNIKNKSYTAETGNTYFEINDLMEFLAKQDEEQKNKKIVITSPASEVTPLFETFLENVKTLSPAEKKVFDLYIKDYKAQMIADELFLSINTIKTHNRRIFAKLNVSSRKEMLVYIDMMREMNIINEE